ncbi:hypothetical protein [Endozoicomonas sp. Mp262]|uniref:hypothetical protein n=1 Tax=Endozoicomonas sp. Mp262 TaxID=2919499 RepID=UPI0021DA82A9
MMRSNNIDVKKINVEFGGADHVFVSAMFNNEYLFTLLNENKDKQSNLYSLSKLMGASGLIRATLFTSNIGNLEKIKNLQDKFPKSWYKDLEIVVQPPADEYDYSLSLWLVMGDDVTVTTAIPA